MSDQVAVQVGLARALDYGFTILARYPVGLCSRFLERDVTAGDDD